jgi:hypothetical protein
MFVAAFSRRAEEKADEFVPAGLGGGMLGSGYREASLDKAIELGAQMIGYAAWNSLIADPNRIKSIGTRSWAATGQP